MLLDRQSETPLYFQLYQQIKADYDPQRDGDRRLWSVRRLAQNLGVSKTTVVQAYEQLLAEGLVYSVPGSGYYFHQLQAWPGVQAPAATTRTSSLNEPTPTAPCRYDLRYGHTPLIKPSWNAWKKAVREALRQVEEAPADHAPIAQGSLALRQRLVAFLKTTRGVDCQADQIVITNGAKAGLAVLLSLLPAGTVGIENPGYRGLQELATGYQHRVVSLPVTPTGVDLKTVKQLAPAVVYTTPAHQFPLGVVMPVTQRLQLLEWAAHNRRLIIEDDYDSEYRYASHPLPALQSLATAGQVVYLGRFSRSIDPSLRMGYLVLPPQLVPVYQAQYRYRSPMVAGLIQQAMLNYFDSGAYYRHINRSRVINRKKYDLVCAELARTTLIEPIATGAGLHMVVRIPNLSQTKLLAALAEQSVRIYPLESNWQRMPTHDYYLLGFAALTHADLTIALRRLVSVCERLGHP